MTGKMTHAVKVGAQFIRIQHNKPNKKSNMYLRPIMFARKICLNVQQAGKIEMAADC